MMVPGKDRETSAREQSCLKVPSGRSLEEFYSNFCLVSKSQDRRSSHEPWRQRDWRPAFGD